MIDLLGQFSEEADEWLLELVVALGRDVVVLEILLPVEGNLFGFHLSVLHVYLVADEDDWDVLAYTNEVLVPLGHVLVSNS